MIRSRLPKLEVPGLPFHDYFFKTTRKFADDVAMVGGFHCFQKEYITKIMVRSILCTIKQ